ncbi:MAG: leucine-rich repeat domain-containing protein [Bacteroidales bacterium]
MKRILLSAFSFLFLSSLIAQTEFTQEQITYVTTSEGHVAIKKSAATGEVVIPSSVTHEGKSYTVSSIRREAFKWGSLTGITLPECMDTIGYNAFGSCANITRISMPETLSVIEPYAFSGCKLLEQITLPSGLEGIPGNLFFTCYALKSVNIPSGIKYIGGAAFYKTAIENIQIPETCDSIARTAFLFCAQLQNLQLPNNLKYLGAGALQGCAKLNQLVIPAKIDSLCDDLLMGCSGLTTFHFPASLKKIGKSVFAHTGITAFTMDKDHPSFVLENGAVYDKTKKMLMVHPIKGRTECIVPEGVIGIWNGAFYGSDVEKVTLPETIRAIDESVFAESKLSSINFPKSLVFLGPTCLYRTQFTKITLPENLEILHDGLLAYCPNLTSVTIPAKVNYIDSHAFSQNKKLTEVTCLSATPPALYDYYEEDENPFGWVARDKVTIYVPQGSLSAYKSSLWKMFSNIVESQPSALVPVSFRPQEHAALKSVTNFDILFEEVVTPVSSAKAPVLRKGSIDGTVVPVTSKWSVIQSPDDKLKKTIRIVSFDYDGYTEYTPLLPDTDYYLIIPQGAIKGATSGQTNQEMIIHYQGEKGSGLTDPTNPVRLISSDNRHAITVDSGIYDLEVYDMKGTKLCVKTNVSGTCEIPSYPKGVYLLKVIVDQQIHLLKYFQE